MLEGLKDVDWKKYQGGYGLGRDMPEQIRLLLSPDVDIRSKAQAIVREDMTHQLSVYPVTSYVIPFLIEILASDNCLNIDWILDVLYCIITNSHRAISYTTNTLGSQYILRCFEAYHAVEKGYNTYVHYLNHPDAGIRYHTVILLSSLTQHKNNTRFKFKQLLKPETHPIILSTLLLKLEVPFGYSDRYRSRQQAYQNMMIEYMTPEKHILVQLSAVLAWLELAKKHIYAGPDTVPERVFEIYFDMIKADIDIFDYVDFELYNDFYLRDIVKPHYIYENLAKLGLERVAPRLCSEDLNVSQVHYLARELLNIAFDRITRTVNKKENLSYHRWRIFGGWLNQQYKSPLGLKYSNVSDLEEVSNQDTVTNLTYHVPQSKRSFETTGLLVKWQIPIIRVIVECDKFWQLETNLFSFFYGLPDDREQLRQLIESDES